jgi:peptidyl-prolyl cis-trans isomerase D
MLSFFRGGGVAKAVMAVIVFMIILVFALEFRPGRGMVSGMHDECAVEYDGYCVRSKEYFAAYGLIGASRLSPKQVKQLELRKQVLDGLIERELLIEAAQRYGLGVSEDALNAELEQGRVHVSLPAESGQMLSFYLGLCVRAAGFGCEPGTEMLRQLDALTDGKFDYDRYVRNVRVYTNRSPKEFKEMQEREVIAARMRSLVKSRVRISEREAFQLFERERSKAVARVVQLRADWFSRYTPGLTDAEIDAWALANEAVAKAAYEATKAGFVADCPLAREVMVEFGPGASDEEKTLKRAEIEAAAERLKKGEPFASVARSVSDAEQAALGGELGCLSEAYGAGAQALLQAAGELEPGQQSPIIESVRGFHILELEGRLESARVDEAAKRYATRKAATLAAAKDRAKTAAEKLIAEAKSGTKLDAAVAALLRSELGLGLDAPDDSHAGLRDDDRPKVEVTAPFAATGSPLQNAVPGASPAAALFDLLKPDDVLTEPVATMDGFAVAQLKEKDPATEQEFEKDRPRVMRQLREAKALEALALYVEELRKNAGEELRIDERYSEEPKGDDSGES